MTPSRSRPAGRDLTPDLFNSLLACLGSTETEAAARYNSLRDRLVHFFGWQGVTGAEDLADEVFNRVARRLHEGEDISNIAGYCLGVARLVALEAREHAGRERRTVEEYARRVSAADQPADERALQCLDRCLARVAPERREQLLLYYTGDHGTRIRQRERLGLALRIKPVALRNRMLRLRKRLELCLDDCLAGRARRDGTVEFGNTNRDTKPSRGGDPE